MKIIKYLWPVMMVAVLCYCCAQDWKRVLIENGDEMDFSITYFLLLTPVCSFILSLWYGYTIRSAFKWLIVLMCRVGATMIATFCTGYTAFWEEWRLGIISLVFALIGMLIGTGIRRIRSRKNKVKYT